MLGYILNPKISHDYHFHSEILLGDGHSKHILIILVIDSWNFIKLQHSHKKEKLSGNATKSADLLLQFNFTQDQTSEPAHVKLFKTSSPVRKALAEVQIKEKKIRKV